MRFSLPLLIMIFLMESAAHGQHSCASREYLEREVRNNSGLQQQLLLQESRSIASFQQELLTSSSETNKGDIPLITIPVVVHVLYNRAEQNISDAQILSQIEVLNREFRLQHADTFLIPSKFRNLAADCRIQFAMARVNPQGYASNGIVRKVTSVILFGLDDRIKFSAMGGDDAWDSKRYLNIWVGNLVSGVIGYSSPLGGSDNKSGVAISFFAFGTTGAVKAPYTRGRTTVHELGHWMGLRHIWGDQVCGNDGIDDTPPQSTATRGCPSGVVVSTCGNPSLGNMYNNYMDLTNDDCTNMFTLGQRDKMRSAFLPGAPLNALLQSDAATATPKPGPSPEQLSITSFLQIYPNPSVNQITIDISRQQDMIGSTAVLINQLGQQLLQVRLTGNQTQVNLQGLRDGVYFLKTNRQLRPVKIIKGTGAASSL